MLLGMAVLCGGEGTLIPETFVAGQEGMEKAFS